MRAISMSNLNYALILCAVFVIAIGQIIFKFAAQNLRIESGQPMLTLIWLNRLPIGMVCLAFALYALSTIAWVAALRTVPLSVAFLFNSLAFIIVPLAGFAIFGELMPKYFVPGLILIVGGIALITRT